MGWSDWPKSENSEKTTSNCRPATLTTPATLRLVRYTVNILYSYIRHDSEYILRLVYPSPRRISLSSHNSRPIYRHAIFPRHGQQPDIDQPRKKLVENISVEFNSTADLPPIHSR